MSKKNKSPRRVLYEREEVLTYSLNPKPRKTVAKHYRQWRKAHGLPERCDNEKCAFHTKTLEWNSGVLKMILDHVSGNRNDNTVGNLRLLCPNCDSQCYTRGGRNIGRIMNSTDSSYNAMRPDDGMDANVFIKELPKVSLKAPNAEASAGR